MTDKKRLKLYIFMQSIVRVQHPRDEVSVQACHRRLIEGAGLKGKQKSIQHRISVRDALLWITKCATIRVMTDEALSMALERKSHVWFSCSCRKQTWKLIGRIFYPQSHQVNKTYDVIGVRRLQRGTDTSGAC